MKIEASNPFFFLLNVFNRKGARMKNLKYRDWLEDEYLDFLIEHGRILKCKSEFTIPLELHFIYLESLTGEPSPIPW
jgi:hypothetical protein